MAARALPEEQESTAISPQAAPNFCVHHTQHACGQGRISSSSSRELSLHWDGVSRQINVFMSKSRELITSAKSIWVNKLKLYLGNLK